ncbi:unnamed protein product [Clonostachys rosea f. rosea IK726]|uniref:Uncharacterized protein n=1 Tax=Clonostachys rosea f. rosea IK726 TaxID=1349383 RepID=A0ACA9UM04_BIOOC|nr:unnamed protein product [Clonostachys rosea f. rosea IK726]
MDIEIVFPEDPLESTVKYAGAQLAPFSVPWAKGRVQLCTGFNTQRSQNDALFLTRSAFRDVRSVPLHYRQCQLTSIRDESATDIASKSEITSFAISASVGGGFLGASGRGSYEKSKSNISVRAEHTCGQIELVYILRLDLGAIRLLSDSPDPVNEFRRTYGDFYVAGLRVGAVNNTTISGEMANKSFFKTTRLQLKIKALFLTYNKSIDDVNQSKSNSGGLSVAAFDSLTSFYSNFTAHSLEDGLAAGYVASDNKQRAMNIGNRASDVLFKEFSLGLEGTVYQDSVDRLCDRGLVTELLLAPFSSLREYQSLLSLRYNRR